MKLCLPKLLNSVETLSFHKYTSSYYW